MSIKRDEHLYDFLTYGVTPGYRTLTIEAKNDEGNEISVCLTTKDIESLLLGIKECLDSRLFKEPLDWEQFPRNVHIPVIEQYQSPKDK